MERHFFRFSRALNARKRKIFALFFALAASIGLMNAKVTWNSSNISDLDVNDYQSYSKEGVTLSANADMIEAFWVGYIDESHNGIGFNARNTGGYTFSNTLGKNFTKIEMTLTGPSGWDNANLGSGWSYSWDYNWDHPATATWTGNASTVDLLKDASDFSPAEYVKSIVFYFEGDSQEPDPTEGIEVPEGGEIFVLTDSIMTREEGAFMFAYEGEGWVPECQYMVWHAEGREPESRWSYTTMYMVGTDGPEFGARNSNLVRLEINFASTTGGGALAEGWSLSGNKYIWTGSSKSVRFYHTGATISGITSVVYVFDGKCHRDPQRFTDTVKIEDLVVGDTLAMGAQLISEVYGGFYLDANRVRYHGVVQTQNFRSTFSQLGAVSKHGAMDNEYPENRGCLEPINENGELGEEWIVISLDPLHIAGIGTASAVTNTCYTSEVDYAALEPGDTIAYGASIINTPEKVWFRANRMQRSNSGETFIIEDDRYMEGSYGTFGKNGVITDKYGTTFAPINEQGTLGGKWVVVFYSPLTIAGIGEPAIELTLSKDVSIIGLPIAGINDIGDNNYEVEQGTQFQIQAAAAPAHYSFIGWSDLASTDPNYAANPRTITINSDSTIQPIYAIDTYTLTLGVNDESRGSVKITPGMKKIIWDKAYLRTVIALASSYMSGPSTYDYVNNIKDGIMMDPQAYYSEVHFRYVPELGYSALYLRAVNNVYDAGLLFHKTDGAVFDKFQLVEIYTPEANHNFISDNYTPWSYNTSKGCYQIEEFSTQGSVEINEAYGNEVDMRVDSIIFYAPSDLPQGVTPTETPGVYTVEWGSEISFVATPASEDYHLGSWSNGSPVTGDTLTLTMTGELALTANFAHVPYMITLPEGVSIVAPVPAGITDKGNGVYEVAEGTQFQISADSIPEHYHFDHWADLADSVAMYAANPRTIVAGENLTVEPIFAIDTYTLTLATNDSTKGVVAVEGGLQEPSAQLIVPESWSSEVGVTITAADLPGFVASTEEAVKALPVPTEGNVFVIYNFKDNGGVEAVTFENGEYVRTTSSAVDHANASYYSNQGMIFLYTTAAGQAGQGGEGEEPKGIVDNGDGTYTVDYGTELTFVAKPAEGFMLESWSNGAPVTGDTLKLTMTEELSLTANFKHIPATIMLPEGVSIVEPMPAGITSKGEGVYEVEYGTEFQISADSIPAHYHFDHWADLADSAAMYAANPRTIVAGENLTIEPIFAIDTYKLTLATNDSTKGVVSVEGAGADKPADSVTPISIPDNWTADAALVTAADLPGFVATTEEAAKAMPIPTEGNVLVFFDFTDDNKVKTVQFENGEYLRTTTSELTHGTVKLYSNNGWLFVYTTASGEQPGDVPATGKIIDNGDGTYTVDWGTELTFTAKAADGYHVQSWSNGAEVNDLVEATQTITMTEALDLSALFAENPIITLASNDSTMGIVTLAGAGKQLTVDGDGGSTNQNVPIRTAGASDNRTLNQSIYPAALLSGIAGDSISGMTFYISGPSAQGITATYVVKLMETEQAAFSDAVAADASGATTVYTGTLDVTGNTMDIVFDQPYAYNGGNLLVQFGITEVSATHAVTFFSVFASQGGTFQQYYHAGFEEIRYYKHDFLAKTTFICGGSKGIPGVIDLGNGQYNVLPGTELTFVAQPAERFMLDSWSNGAPVNGDSLTLTVTDSLTLTANFKYIPAVITLPEGVNIVEPLPAGITALGEGVYEVEHGTEFQITADGAPEHYHFDHWADLDSTNTEYYANPRTVVADTNFTANPFYTIDTYVITLASNDTTMGKLTIEPAEGIVANGDGTYTVDWGTEVTFVAVPAEDYHLLSWSNGAEVTEDNKQTLTITDSLNISAFFKHDTYMLTVEGAEVEVAKFYDGTNTAVVTNPGTLIGVQAGDSVKLTTTATFSSADIADNLTITLHYAIEVIEDGVYDNEYALAVTDSLYDKKGFIIEPMIPDTTAAPQEEEAEVKEGIEVYGYGYCADGDMTGMLYHLKHGNPNQYKVEFEDARFDDVDWTDLDEKGPEGVIYVTVPVDVPTGDYKMTVTFRDHTEYYSLESEPITITFHVNLPETYVVALFDNVIAVVDTCECLTDIQWYWRANSTDQWQAIEGATGYYYKQEGGLSGEYFIKAKMNGIDTYTCPQDDMSLYGDNKQAKVSAYPNPVENSTTVTIENSRSYEHTLRIVNLMGNEMMTTSFEGNTTSVEMGTFPQGHYMISVDGVVVKVMKK